MATVLGPQRMTAEAKGELSMRSHLSWTLSYCTKITAQIQVAMNAAT